MAAQLTLNALCFVVEMLPMGTNLGMLRLLWAMLNGSFLRSRGAIHPALSESGFTEEEVQHSWSAFRYGSWKIEELLGWWHTFVLSKNEWKERRYSGYKVLSIDLTGFWRPRLSNWEGTHYNSMAGKALPAVVFGVMVLSGDVRGNRIPLIEAIERCEAEESESEIRIRLLKKAQERPESESEVKAVDAGFYLSEIHEAKTKNYVVRGAKNCTGRRNELPEYKGGRPAQYGAIVRPLARKRKGNTIAATPPDKQSEFLFDGRDVKGHSWSDLVTYTTKVADDGSTFSIHVYFDPAYKNPLVLITDLDISPEDAYLIYKDRWPVEQTPLAAKQMLGLHRQFVSAEESCYRLPEIAMLAGNILTYVAAVSPPIPTGFWDRNPQSTPGRLRRYLAQLDFPKLTLLPEAIRKKNSVHQHLPKGVLAHRRQKANTVTP